jgi:hypothetical protein
MNMDTTKKASGWTPEEEAIIAGYMKPKAEGGLGMTRSNAVRKMRAPSKPVSAKDVNTLAVKMAKQAVKAVARAKKAVAEVEPSFKTKPAGDGVAWQIPGKSTGRYDKQLVVNLFMEEVKTPTEIAKLGSAGIKGISPVFCHRILFGNENSGGIDKGQATRRKEQAARWEASAKTTKDKK